jgi:hypothetical protein
MRAKVLTLALVAAIIALPVPASQVLTNGTFSPAPASAAAARDNGALGLLLQDPFLIDRMSYEAPRSFVELGRLAA